VLIFFKVVEKYKTSNILYFPLIILSGFLGGMYLTAIERKHFFWDTLKIENYYEYYKLIDGISIVAFLLIFFIMVKLVWTINHKKI